jgi:hypothetical protein
MHKNIKCYAKQYTEKNIIGFYKQCFDVLLTVIKTTLPYSYDMT